jgi:TPP-dependent pyruvate/acetoin dehydrogenase alpha subunit
MGPHSSSDDPTRYRSQEEVETWAKRDPIARLERYLRTAEILDDATLEGLEAGIRAELDAALAEVEELGPPARATVFEDVFAALPPHLQRQQAQFLAMPPAQLAHH